MSGSIDFNSIKNLSGKALSEIGSSSITKICLEGLNQQNGQEIEIFNFILIAYPEATQISAETLKHEILSHVLSEAIEYFKKQLANDSLPDLCRVFQILCKLTFRMKKNFFVDHPNPLFFATFFIKSLEIVEMSLDYCNRFDSSQNFVELTRQLFKIFLGILISNQYFLQEVDDNDSKFHELISLLSSIASSNLGKPFANQTAICLSKIMLANYEGIIQRINSPLVADSLEKVVGIVNDVILTSVHQFTNEEQSNLESVQETLKVLKHLSEVFAENFRGHKHHLHTILKLIEIQHDDNLRSELKEEVYHLYVGYMISLNSLFKSLMFHQKLSELFGAPKMEIPTLGLSLEICKLVLKNDQSSVIQIYCPANKQNIFQQILNFLAGNEWILNFNFYESTLVQLTHLLKTCLAHELTNSFQFMERSLIQHLISGKIVLGALCADIFIIFGRIISPQMLSKYIGYFHEICSQNRSLLSNNFLSTKFLQNLYRMLSPKYKSTIEMRDNLQENLMDFNALKDEEKDQIVKEFADHVDDFVTEKTEDLDCFYKMLSLLNWISSSKIKSNDTFNACVKKLFNSLKNIQNLGPFNSYVIILLQVVENTSEFPLILQYMMPLMDFLNKHHNTLEIEIKYKVIKLMDHLVKKIPKNFGAQGFQSAVVMKIKNISRDSMLVLNMRLYKLFLDNSENFVLKEAKNDRLLKEIMMKKNSFKKLEAAILVGHFQKEVKKHCCRVESKDDGSQKMFEDMDWKPEPDSTTGKYDLLDTPPSKKSKLASK